MDDETKDRILSRDTESLPVRLTIDEMASLGAAIGRCMADRRRQEEDFDAKKDDHRSRMKRIDVEIATIGDSLNSGMDYRDVETLTVLNWNAEQVETRRSDNGTVVRTRPLRPEERQHELFRRGDPRAAVPEAPENDEALARKALHK